MLITATAYLTLINADNQSRAQSNVVSTLSSVLETMSRTIRNGSEYWCDGGELGASNCYANLDPSSLYPSQCFSFFSKETQKTFAYFSDEGILYRKEARCGDGATAEPLTDPGVHINTLNFYVSGADKRYQGDYFQPRVTIVIAGYMNIRKGGGLTQVPFSLQTIASQRELDN
jgi:hypothetical protein